MKLFTRRAFERIRDRISCLLESDRTRIVRQFEAGHGYLPDLENPKTWSEKVQWMKLYDHDPLYTRCTDKYRMRDYVAEVAGDRYLVPMLGVHEDAHKIDFDALPASFVIKANHGCGWNLLIRNQKTDLDRRAVVTRCNGWLAKNYYVNHREWQYKEIAPRLIVEELLLEDEGSVPADIKIHCFDHGRFGGHIRDHYNEHWRRIDLTFAFDQSEKGTKRPERLDDMVASARQLAQPFRNVRVDLYLLRTRIYLGEMAFSPGSVYAPFVPEAVDRDWGDRFMVSGSNP